MKNKFIYFAILPALFFQLIGALFYFVLFADTSFSHVIYFGTKVLIVVWPLFFLSHIKSFHWPFWKGEMKKSLWVGLLSGLGFIAFAVATYLLFHDFWLGFSPKIKEAAADLNVIEHYILFSFFLSVIHSFIEEYYWRWFVLNGLMLKFKKSTAMVLSSLAFVSHHFIVVLVFSNWALALLASFGIFLMALFWCHCYLKTKTLSGIWLSHFLADLVLMSIGYLLIFT